MQGSTNGGKPASVRAGPWPGVPREGQPTPAMEKPGPAGLEGRKRRPRWGPSGHATAQELYLRFQELRLEAEALRDALAAKGP